MSQFVPPVPVCVFSEADKGHLKRWGSGMETQSPSVRECHTANSREIVSVTSDEKIGRCWKESQGGEGEERQSQGVRSLKTREREKRKKTKLTKVKVRVLGEIFLSSFYSYFI